MNIEHNNWDRFEATIFTMTIPEWNGEPEIVRVGIYTEIIQCRADLAACWEAFKTGYSEVIDGTGTVSATFTLKENV